MLAEILPKIAFEDQEARQDYRARPSSAGPERCERSMVYHGLGVEGEKIAGRGIMVMDDSSWHEELTLDWARKSAYQIHSQQLEVVTRVGPGHIDGMLTDLLGRDTLLEHKAINHFSFQRLTAQQLPLDYLTQLALYLDGIRTHLNPELSRGLLLVKNKNTAQYLEYAVSLHEHGLVVESITWSTGETEEINRILPTLLEDAVAKFARVQSFIDKKQLPPRPFPFGMDFPCGYCAWQTTCWEGYQEETAAREGELRLQDPELEKLLAHYADLGKVEKAAGAEREELRNKLLVRLADAKVKKIITGGMQVYSSVSRRKWLNQDALPDDARAAATEIKTAEILYVRPVAAPKGKKKSEQQELLS